MIIIIILSFWIEHSHQWRQETASGPSGVWSCWQKCVTEWYVLSLSPLEELFLSLSFQPKIFSKAAQSLKYDSPLLIRDCLSSLGSELTSGQAKYENESHEIWWKKKQTIYKAKTEQYPFMFLTLLVLTVNVSVAFMFVVVCRVFYFLNVWI